MDLRRNLQISVNEEDIIKGIPGHTCDCPVGRAVARSLEVRRSLNPYTEELEPLISFKITVSPSEIMISTETETAIYSLPATACSFISRFDHPQENHQLLKAFAFSAQFYKSY